MGREALEVLRKVHSQRYALPLLISVTQIPVEEEYKEEQKLYVQFRDMFSALYQKYGKPHYRLWQTITVNNTHEFGLTLQMLRQASGKTREKAVEHQEIVISPRQLARIEKGQSKPSKKTCTILMKTYGRTEEWGVLMIETMSVRGLQLQQEINEWIGMKQWKRAQEAIEQFEELVDTRMPQSRQKLMYWKGVLKAEQGDKTRANRQECIELLKRALQFTLSDKENKKWEWWVYSIAEGMIISNIALMYRELGDWKEAKRWCNNLYHSMKLQMHQTQVPYQSYEILMEQYVGVLGDMKNYSEAIQLGEEAVERILNSESITGIQVLFYHLSWNEFQIASQNQERETSYQNKWKNNFEFSELLAMYVNDFDA